MGTRRNYTAEEDAIIRVHYPTQPRAVFLALLPDRKPTSIKERACRLGVHRQHRCGGTQIPCEGPVLTALTEAERGYLAGLIDGEGCLRLSRSKSAQGKPTYHVMVVISTTSRPLLEWLLAKLPGTYCESRKIGWRTRWNWKVSGNLRALSLLRDIAPYLVTKRAQAELLANGYIHLTDDEREAVYQRLAEMKQDG